MQINDNLLIDIFDVPNQTGGGFFMGSVANDKAIKAASVFNFNQTTPDKIFAIRSGAKGQIIVMNNVGTAAFIFGTNNNKTLISPNESVAFIFNGTTWSFLLGKNKSFSRENTLFSNLTLTVDFLSNLFLYDNYDLQEGNASHYFSAKNFVSGGVYTLRFQNSIKNTITFDVNKYQDINGNPIVRTINGSAVFQFVANDQKLVLMSVDTGNIYDEVKTAHGNYTILPTTKNFFYQDVTTQTVGYTLILPPQYPEGEILNIFFSNNLVDNDTDGAGYVKIQANVSQTILCNFEGRITAGSRVNHEMISLKYNAGYWRITNFLVPN